MAPYVKLLVPELQKAIVDPLPDVRAQASKALGAIMRDMGQEALQDVMPWLIDTLKSKGSSVERSGAAQVMNPIDPLKFRFMKAGSLFHFFIMFII